VPIEQVLPRLKNGIGGYDRRPSERRHEGSSTHVRERVPEQHYAQQQAPQRSQHESTGPARQQAQRDMRLGGAPRQEERDKSILSPSEISRKLLNKEPARSGDEQVSMKIDPELGIKDIEREDAHGIDSVPHIDGRQASASDPDQKYVGSLEQLHNTLRGRIYDRGGNIVSEVPIRELIQAIQDANDIDVIVFDGIITQRLIELANKRGARAIYGTKAGQISRIFDNMLLYTKEHGKLGN